MNKNLNSELKREEIFTYDPLRRGVEGSPDVVGRKPFGKRPTECTTCVNHLLSK
jgi:hypothetical protein